MKYLIIAAIVLVFQITESPVLGAFLAGLLIGALIQKMFSN